MPSDTMTTSDHKRPQLTTSEIEGIESLKEYAEAKKILEQHALCLAKGGAETKEMRIYLMIHASCILNTNGFTDFESDIDYLIEGAHLKKWDVKRSLTEEIRELVVTTNGHITTTNCHQWLQLTTRKEKKAANMALLRLVDEGILEKNGNHAGTYRKVDRDFTIADLKNVNRVKLDIKLPFGMEKFVSVKPGNVILFQGYRGAGKSTLLYECARLNCDKYPVYFFSYEADDEEFLDTVEQHNYTTIDEWQKINFSDNATNYIDIIQPDAINILDYIKPGGKYQIYEIPQILDQIRDKLNKGVAFVALQKNKDKLVGLGGEQVEGPPRIVCNIDIVKKNISRLLIRKCKSKGPRAKEQRLNPEDGYIEFKTFDGINLTTVTDWVFP